MRPRPGKPVATATSPSPSARANCWRKSANSSHSRKALTQRTRRIAQRTQGVAENEIGTAIIAAAMKVHAAVGPGLLESAYETCLLYELEKQGLRVSRQGSIP